MGIAVGITGGIGSGKTLVTRIFSSMGYPVFYSDKVAKELMLSDESIQSKVISLFGEKAYQNNELNRKYLAEKIFNNNKLKESLNQIIHPAVRKAFDEFCNIYNDKTPVFNEAAILFETGAYKRFNFNILVTCDEEIRINRVINRDAASREEVKDRLKNQWSDDKKKPLADFIVTNDDTEMVIPQLLSILEKLKNA